MLSTPKKCYKSICKFSPDGHNLAYAASSKLLELLDIYNNKVIFKYTTQNSIIDFLWCPSSNEYIIVYPKSPQIEVRTIKQLDLSITISQTFPISFVIWVSSDKLILVGENNFYISLWDLRNEHIYNYQMKFNTLNCVSFNERFLCTLDCINGNDYICIFNLNDLKDRTKFQVHNYTHKILLIEPKILAFMETENSILIYDIMGNQYAELTNIVDLFLLINDIKVSPNEKFIALGNGDNHIKLVSIQFNNIMMTIDIIEELKKIIDYRKNYYKESKSNNNKLYIYKETKTNVAAINESECIIYGFDEVDLNGIDNLILNTLKLDKSHKKFINYEESVADILQNIVDDIEINFKVNKPYSIGISLVEISKNFEYIAGKSELLPNFIWIWNCNKSKLVYIVIYLNVIKDFKWQPYEKKDGSDAHETLFVVFNNNKIAQIKIGENGILKCFGHHSSNLEINSVDFNTNGEKALFKGDDFFSIGEF